jgi:hypothetical protein
MMLEEWLPIESQVGLSRVIASNSTKLDKANFGDVIVWYQRYGLAVQNL